MSTRNLVSTTILCDSPKKGGYNLSKLYSRIELLVKSKGLTVNSLCKKAGVPSSVLYEIKNGRKKDINRQTAAKLAAVLDMTVDELYGEKSSDVFHALPVPTITDDIVEIPVIGEIAAGYNMLANEEWNGETVSVPASYLKGRTVTDFFVLSVKGSSMYPHYQDGDKVLILKQDHILNSGDVGAVVYDSECVTLKKIEIQKDLIKLVPINPEYEPKEIKGADLEKCHILGVPRLLIREFE